MLPHHALAIGAVVVVVVLWFAWFVAARLGERKRLARQHNDTPTRNARMSQPTAMHDEHDSIWGQPIGYMGAVGAVGAVGANDADDDDKAVVARDEAREGSSNGRRLTSIASRVSQPLHGSAFHFRMPLRFKDGVPMVSVRIDGQPHEFYGVADTGSHHLNVSADTCTACDGTYGSFVTTPQLLAELFVEPTVWLRYGTQHDASKVIRGAGVQLHVGGPSVAADVHVTVERSLAASNFNVIGLLRGGTGTGIDLVGSNATSGRTEFLSQILPASSALYIRFYGESATSARHGKARSTRRLGSGVDNGVENGVENGVVGGRGFVAGIHQQAVPAVRRNATVVAPLLPLLKDVGSYVVSLTALRIGGRQIDGAPKFMLLDTGSNKTSFPRDVFREMLPGLLRGATLTLEIAHQPVHIERSTYVWVAGQTRRHGGDHDSGEEWEQGEDWEQGGGGGGELGESARDRNEAPDLQLMIDDDLRILDDSPQYAIWGAHTMRGHNLVFTGDGELLLTPAVPHPDTGLVPDDDVLR